MCDTHMSRIMCDTYPSCWHVWHTHVSNIVWHTHVSFNHVWYTHVSFTCVTHTCLAWCVTHTRIVYMCTTRTSRTLCDTHLSRLYEWHTLVTITRVILRQDTQWKRLYTYIYYIFYVKYHTCTYAYTYTYSPLSPSPWLRARRIKWCERPCACIELHRVSPRVQSYIISLFDYVIKTVSLSHRWHSHPQHFFVFDTHGLR